MGRDRALSACVAQTDRQTGCFLTPPHAQVVLLDAADQSRGPPPSAGPSAAATSLPAQRAISEAALRLATVHRGSEIKAEEYTATIKLTAFPFYNAFCGRESYKFNIN